MKLMTKLGYKLLAVAMFCGVAHTSMAQVDPGPELARNALERNAASLAKELGH